MTLYYAERSGILLCSRLHLLWLFYIKSMGNVDLLQMTVEQLVLPPLLHNLQTHNGVDLDCNGPPITY